MTKADPSSNNLAEPVDGVFGGINQLTSSLRDLDDRGLVLSFAAFAEEALGDLLKAFMMPSDATNQLIEGFNAPLGTFSSRIKAAYAIGLVTKDQFQDLERLRKIRNEFAHSWKPVNLAKQKVASLIDGMAFSRFDQRFPVTPTEKIRSSMTCLLIELRSSTHQIHERGMQAKLVGNHLLCGFSGDFTTQIKNARKELNDIFENIEKAQGKTRSFYLMLLIRFKERLIFLAGPKDMQQKKTRDDFLEEFRNLLNQVST